MGQDKREQIIQAAIEVFARQGLEKGKIADIATAAGIGKGTVYGYFRSKEDLFTAIEVTVLGGISSILEKVMKSDLPPGEKLVTIMNESVDQMIQMGDALLIVTELWAQAARGHWHQHGASVLVEMYADFRETIILILAEGVEGEEFRQMSKEGVATLLMAFMDGLFWQFVILKDPSRFQKVKTEAIQSFMKGIRK